LQEAYNSAAELSRNAWEFALEIRYLRGVGLTHSQLRWLLCQGYLQQGLEESQAGEPWRRFRPVANLSLAEATCFVLTADGDAFVRALREGRAVPFEPGPRRQQPVWDQDRRELRCGGVLVKSFKQPARSQELVLAAFEEENWPTRIDDPLPPGAEQDPKRRLHSTISNLNRGQRNRLIHFEGGGDGESVQWRPIGVMDAAGR
jgi:hypothetical protein